MAVVTRFPTTNAVVAIGWTNPANAYADDAVYATAAPAKNGTITSDFGGFGFDGLIAAGSTINSVTITVQWNVSTTGSVDTMGLQAYVGGVASGTEFTTTTLTTADTIDTTSPTGLTRDNLLDANFAVRARATRGNINTAFTGSIDYVSVAVDYTAGVVTHPLTGTVAGTSSTAGSFTSTGIDLRSQAVNGAGGVTSIGVTGLTTQAGSLLVALVGVGTATLGPIGSVTDSAGNTWTFLGFGVQGTASSRVEMWYSANAAPVTSVTATNSNTTARTHTINVSEWTGVATTAPVDVSATGGGIGTSQTSPSVTPTTGVSDALFIAANFSLLASNTVTLVAGDDTALTNFDVSGSAYGRAAYRIGAVAATAETATWTFATADDAGHIAVIFKPAAAVTTALSGAVTGTSATTASALVMDRPLSGSVVGTSVTAVSALTLTHPLAGAVTATSATAATSITISPALSGAAAGTSAAAALRIVITPTLTGAMVATSATAATSISVGHSLSAATVGTSATAGAFTALGTTLTGAVTGTSAIAATRLTISHPIAGAVAGTSATAGVRLVLTHPLAASAAGTSATAGAFVATGAVLTGAVTGTSATSASRLTLTHPLSGAVAGTSATAGTFAGLAVTLTGTSVGTSATAATRITLDQPLAASASGTSILAAPRLVLTHPLDGSALGSSVVAAGGVRIGHALIGGVAGSSLTGADLLFTILARRTFMAPHTVATFMAGRTGPTFVAIRPARSFTAADTTTGTLVAARTTRTFDGSGPS